MDSHPDPYCLSAAAGVPNLAMVETVDDEKVNKYLSVAFDRMYLAFKF